MRPVVRGDVPTDEFGNPVTFDDYKDARDYLIDRMGDYCSYCEVALHSYVDVEHVQPKSLHPHLEREWSNFLLACGNCNSIKGHRTINLADYYWPDRHNTLRTFVYPPDLPPQVGTAVEMSEERARATIQLTGLDRIPGHPKFSDRDRRWLKRFHAWGKAQEVLSLLTQNDTVQMRQLAVQVALGVGFFSVWWTVFQHDANMRTRLIQAFAGTAADCFDDFGNTVSGSTDME